MFPVAQARNTGQPRGRGGRWSGDWRWGGAAQLACNRSPAREVARERARRFASPGRPALPACVQAGCGERKRRRTNGAAGILWPGPGFSRAQGGLRRAEPAGGGRAPRHLEGARPLAGGRAGYAGRRRRAWGRSSARWRTAAQAGSSRGQEARPELVPGWLRGRGGVAARGGRTWAGSASGAPPMRAGRGTPTGKPWRVAWGTRAGCGFRPRSGNGFRKRGFKRTPGCAEMVIT